MYNKINNIRINPIWITLIVVILIQLFGISTVYCDENTIRSDLVLQGILHNLNKHPMSTLDIIHHRMYIDVNFYMIKRLELLRFTDGHMLEYIKYSAVPQMINQYLTLTEDISAYKDYINIALGVFPEESWFIDLLPKNHIGLSKADLGFSKVDIGLSKVDIIRNVLHEYYMQNNDHDFITFRMQHFLTLYNIYIEHADIYGPVTSDVLCYIKTLSSQQYTGYFNDVTTQLEYYFEHYYDHENLLSRLKNKAIENLVTN